MDEKNTLNEREIPKNFLELFPHPFLIINVDDYSVEYANSIAYDGEIKPKMKCYEVTHQSDSPCTGKDHICPIMEVIETKEPLRARHNHFDSEGNDLYVDVYCSPIYDSSRNVIQIAETLTDITEKVAIEERYRQIFDNSPLGLIQNKHNGEIITCNSAFLKLLGYENIEEVKKLHAEDIYFYPEERKEILKKHGKNSAYYNPQFKAKKKDGTPFWVELYSRANYDENNNITHYDGSMMDITEKRIAEQQLIASEEKYKKLSEDLDIQVIQRTQDLLHTQEKLIRQERLGIFRKIAGGIAHEFNNILSTIIGATDILLGDEKKETSLRLLNVILKQSLLASDFAKRMLDFSKTNIIEPKVLEVEEFFKEIQQIFAVSFSVNITITLKTELGKLLIDPFQLQQALMNLLINSNDALSGKGRITIVISAVTDKDVSDFELNTIRSGDYIRIQTEDNGTGMSREVQDNLFVPFYSTKPVGKGSGLGLSQVYGIIRQNSGYIDFESEEGKGTSFYLYIPKYVQG